MRLSLSTLFPYSSASFEGSQAPGALTACIYRSCSSSGFFDGKGRFVESGEEEEEEEEDEEKGSMQGGRQAGRGKGKETAGLRGRAVEGP